MKSHEGKQNLDNEAKFRLVVGPLIDCLIVTGALTVTSVWKVRDEAIALLPRQREIEIDLSGVTDFDNAGVQFLLLLKRSSGNSQAMRFINHSQSVLRLIENIGSSAASIGISSPLRIRH